MTTGGSAGLDAGSSGNSLVLGILFRFANQSRNTSGCGKSSKILVP
jgi:hypothetical protein